ncbi:MAG: hypothetical protein R2748_00225 [Bryobacterales bacterium]
MAKQNAVTAFEGSRLIASGDLATVAAAAKKVLDRGQRGPSCSSTTAPANKSKLTFAATTRLSRPA